MTITTADLLDALLSPDATRRGEAERCFQNVPVLDRVTGLVSLIQQQNNTNVQQQTVLCLAAVLLRRDILRLADVQALQSIVDPLLESFLQIANNDAADQKTRTAMGHCLAEICGTAALLSPSPSDKEQVMARILNAISNAVAQGDIPSLRLLAAMAERAPAVFTATAVSSLDNLIRQVVASSTTPNNGNTVVEALMQVLVQAAIATQQTSSIANPTTNNNSGSLLSSWGGKPVEIIDPSSPAAALGRACLPLLLERLHSSSNNKGKSMLAILQQWTQAATFCPSFLAGDKATLDAVVYVCLAVANTNNAVADDEEVTTALAALEVLSSLCSVGDVKRKMLAVDPVLCQRILAGIPEQRQEGVIAITANWMEQGVDDDVEAWASEPATLLEDDAWDGDDVARYAESLFQSFLRSMVTPALAGTLPLVENLLQQTSQDWRRSRAGLCLMEACIVAAPVSFAPHIPIAMEAALSLASPEQPIRVQWQALHMLGIMCETDSVVGKEETVRQRYGPRILQILAQAVQSPCTTKVSALGSLAIVSYCRGGANSAKTSTNDDTHPVVQYLSDMLQALVTGPLSLDVCDRGAAVVKIRAIGAVACLAEAAEEAFAPFYSAIMPCLLGCAQEQHRGNHEIMQLIGAAIESATIVGQAIESDETVRAQYVNDATQIMQFIVSVLQQTGETTADFPLDQLLSACTRIASVMEGEFSPYVHEVLHHLLQRACAPPDVSISEGDESGLEATKRREIEVDEDLGTESMTISMPGKGIQKVTVNTSKIQEKAQSARAVYSLANALGGHFSPWLEPCFHAMVPLITFQYSSEVRSTAAQASASLFEALCSSADESKTDSEVTKLQQCFPVLVKTITKQIQSEHGLEVEAVYALADALSEIFYSAFKRKDTYGQAVSTSLSLTDAAETVGMTVNAIADCLTRRKNIYTVLSDGGTSDDEKQEFEGQLREEETLLSPLVDSIGYTLKAWKNQFPPLFDKLVAPALGPSLTNGDIRARLSAVCLFDDYVEHCGPQASATHAEKLVYGCLLGIDDQSNGGDLELKSASIYGISQLCRYAPSSVLAPHLEFIFHQLLMVVRSSTKDESESPMMYENAVSALASLSLYGSAPFAHAGFVKRDELLSIFLDNLPIREDPDEAKICHAGFCELAENGSVNISDATKILQLVGLVLFFVDEGENIASQETCSRLAIILMQMQQNLPADRMNYAFGSVSVEAQNGISLAMQ